MILHCSNPLNEATPLSVPIRPSLPPSKISEIASCDFSAACIAQESIYYSVHYFLIYNLTSMYSLDQRLGEASGMNSEGISVYKTLAFDHVSCAIQPLIHR